MLNKYFMQKYTYTKIEYTRIWQQLEIKIGKNITHIKLL